MKYIITGLHSSGKHEVAQDLKRNPKIRVGRTFCNLPYSNSVDGIYFPDQVFYDNNAINEMFENHAYIFLKEIDNYTKPYYTGLSFYEWDNNDVFVLSPEQLIAIPSFPCEVCIIWMDSSTSQRKQRYNLERRDYDFNMREKLEKEDSSEFINKIYKLSNSHLIYFENEEPKRVSAVIQAIHKHNDLLKLFESHYN